MARSPFVGTYRPNARPTVTTAPDALVFINGETDIIGCSNCKRRFDVSKYITSIQTDLSVDSVPGSANITLSIPRHIIDDFMYDGVPLITPMMEIEIFAKGYYLLEGLPQYYPTFWGLITEVNDSYSSGEHTITINCADILKWWEICRMNVNPAFTAPQGQAGRSIFGNVFFGTNPYDTIFTLSNMAMGDVIVGTGSLISLFKEQGQQGVFSNVLGDIMQYWASRFTRIRSNLLMYGVNGVAVRGDSIAQAYETGKATKSRPFASSAVRVANGGNEATQLVFDPTDPNVTAFRTQFSQAGSVNFWQSDYQTKLELANTAKEAIGFEFYMDVTGDIVFKPPFYNLDILSNKPLSWIQDIDIIDWDFGESEAEVVTQMTIQGSFGGNIEFGMGEEATPTTSVTDYHLFRKYGWRPHSYNSEFLSDPLLMFYHGLDMMDRINCRRHRATITIPMRPELRLGFPVYIAPKDQIWYVTGISHSIQFGGRATTSLTLSARREKFKAPKGISTLKLTGDYTDQAVNKSKASVVQATGGKDFSPSKPKAAASGPPTIKQLAKKAFSLELGEAASFPPLNVDPENPASMEPYNPLILRHPKTGRIVGYPNVVMTYTRPFDNAAAEKAFNRLSGHKEPGKNVQTKSANKDKVNATQKQEKNRQIVSFVDEEVSALTQKYSQNRFQYQVNSAGVYVYAHDTSKVVTQFALIPQSHITVSKDSQELSGKDSPLQGGTAMVRPISDERGFEVIGHARYGRGVSLRDGSLVLQDVGKNARISGGQGIDVQVALGGDLYATLNAQSQGITSVVTSYENPAEFLAKLLPDDLQTAGVMVPGSDGVKRPQFTEEGTNFVDVAPLNSPENKGVPLSVEAGQLSRALTLAELNIREDTLLTDCDCQLGRGDLAFINEGYQVKVVNPASPATPLFGDGGVAASSTFLDAQNYRQQASDADAQVKALDDQIAILQREMATAGSPQQSEAIALQVQQLQQQREEAASASTSSTAHANEAINEFNGQGRGGTQPVSNIRFDDIRTKVDDYLFGIYKALDAPHQQLENALRGDPSGLDNGQRRSPNLFTGGEGDPAFGPFAPPFGSMNRSGLGDPVATAQQGSSAMANLKGSFKKFGENLQNNTKRTELSQEIANERALMTRLQNRLQQLQAQGPNTFGNTDTVESLLRQIETASQTIQQKEAELSLLR